MKGKKRNCWRQIIIKETEGGNNVDVLRGRVLAVLCLDTRIMLHNIVFRSSMVAGPVQGLDSGFWPDQFFFKKNSKRCRFNKKKQKSTVCNRVFDRVTPGFFLSYFFFNPAQFQSRVSWVLDRSARPGFKTMLQTTSIKAITRLLS